MEALRALTRRSGLRPRWHAPDGECSLRLDYRSLDGEEGYPGTVDVSVTYTVTSDNTFVIETEAVTDTPTPFNLTHHSYFNLAERVQAPLQDHELQIHSDQYVRHRRTYDTARTICVSELARAMTFAKDNVLAPQFRNCFAIMAIFIASANRVPIILLDELVPAARLVDPTAGRALNISTTESHLQLYTSAALDGIPGREIRCSIRKARAQSALSATAIRTGRMRQASVTTYCALGSRGGTSRSTHFLRWTLTELRPHSWRTCTAQRSIRSGAL